MKPLFKCELSYSPVAHLSQIYEGFKELSKREIVDLSIKPMAGDHSKPLLSVIVNNKFNVIYDTLDGLNWIDGSIEENLYHFKKNIKADFYFKRSYSEKLLNYAPLNCKIYPLGLNYGFISEGKYPPSLKQKFKDSLKDNFIISKFYRKTSFTSRDFQSYPIPSKKNNILFFARLWNPDEAQNEKLKTERELINKNRIDSIKACQKEFGKSFVGGLQEDNFSRLHAKDLILPASLTKKESYLNTIKEHNICIATTGLHDSIGWKFGEYVAASRAIISEPLKYELPGDFNEGKNYFAYNNVDELLRNIHELLKSKETLLHMMNNNYHYYNNYLRPDSLVLNTLLKIYEHEIKEEYGTH